MNYWAKHIGPWLKATVTLSAVEEGIYSRLCDWCYSQETPLPLDESEILLIARARDRTEREATMAMVQRFFVQTETGWRHERIDKEIASSRRRGSKSATQRESELLRRKRSNDKKSLLFKQARDSGLDVRWNMSIASLANLLGRHGIEDAKLPSIQDAARPKIQDAIQDVQDARQDDLTGRPDHVVLTDDGGISNPHSRDIRGISNTSGRPNTVLTGRPERRPSDDLNPYAAGVVCKRIRSLGLSSVNPQDPRLLELLTLGVSEDDIAMAAAQAVARHKGFAYALAIAKGEHERAEHERAEMRKWAPGLG